MTKYSTEECRMLVDAEIAHERVVHLCADAHKGHVSIDEAHRRIHEASAALAGIRAEPVLTDVRSESIAPVQSASDRDVKIRVDNGKYTFVKVFETTSIKILRHGEPWHMQQEAFNAIASLMYALDAARVVLEAARRLGDDAPIAIKEALDRHRALVDDRERPSEWAVPR